jgi:protein O-mannosyl-transferase
MPAQAQPMVARKEPGPVQGSASQQASRSPKLLSLLLALSTLAVFWPAVGHDFINYDDPLYVYENAHVQSGLSWASVQWAFTNLEAGFWHPLTWLSLLADRECFGVRPAGYHLTNLLLHTANVVLLFLALQRMTRASWRSALVAGLFAIHPLRVESVAWVSERKDVLSTFFWMLALLNYVRYARQSEPRGPRSEIKSDLGKQQATRATVPSILRPLSSPSYLLALVFFVCGLMSKTMVITLPFLLLLLDYWPLGRIELSATSLKAKAPAPLIWEKLPFLAAACLASLPTMFGAKALGAFAGSTQLEAAGRLQNALISYTRYLGKNFWPKELSVLYLHPSHWPVWQVTAAAALLLAVSLATLAVARKQPWLVAGWFWFLGTLVPAIGLVQVGIHAMADRYTYVPSIGLFIMLVWGIAEAAPAGRWRSPVLAGSAAFALAACAWLTARQIRYWRDTESLFEHALQVAPDNFIAHNILGAYFSGKGNYDEVVRHYEASLSLKPNYPDPRTHNNLGYALATKGRTDAAIQHYREAIRLWPAYPDPHNNLGIVLASQKRLGEAIAEFEEALRLEPGFAQASNNLATARAERLRSGR